MSSYGSNAIRFTGMASGLDTASLVDAMMLGHKTKIDKQKQNMQTQTWQQEIYRGFRDQIKAFQSKYFDIANKENYLLNSDGLKAKKTTFTDDKNYGINVTTKSETANGSYSVSVLEKASGGRVSGDKLSPTSASNDGGYRYENGSYVDVNGNPLKGIVLDSEGYKLDADGNRVEGSEKYTVNNNGQLMLGDSYCDKDGNPIEKGEIVYDDEGVEIGRKYSEEQLASFKEKDENGEYINVASGSKAVKASTEVKYETNISEIGLKQGDSFTIKVGDKEVTIEIDEKIKSIRDLVNKVNNHADLKGEIKMEYTQRGGFAIETTEKGSGNTFSIEGGNPNDPSAGNALVAMKLEGKTVEEGKDATIEITYPDGTSSGVISSSNNKFDYDGIIIELTEVTKKGDTIEFAVEKDSKGVVDKIKGFVDDFNKLLDDIQAQVYGSKNSDYPPLTDDEKATMTKEEIEEYELKAKEGLLKGDDYLLGMLQDLRNNMFSGKVGDTGVNYKDIGFDNNGLWTDYGKITFDVDKFAAALEESPDLMEKIFISEGDTKWSTSLSGEKKNQRLKECGIFQRMSDIMEGATTTYRDANGRKGTLVEVAGVKGDTTESENVLTKKLKEQQDYVDRLIEQYQQVEARYYKQFTAMETALNQLNSQSASLASMLPQS